MSEKLFFFDFRCIMDIYDGGFMKKVVEIKNLRVQNKLQSISIDFYEDVSVFLCGTGASGKTLLLKAIAGNVPYKGKIVKEGHVEVVFDQSVFFSNSVEDELKYLAFNEEQRNFIREFISDDLLECNPNELDFKMQKIVLLCAKFVRNPDLLFIDNLFSFLDEETKQKFFSYAREKLITLVNVSNDVEEALQYSYMIVLDQGKIAVEGKTKQVLEEEKLLKRLGIGLPFYVDLSTQLKDYGLLQNITYSKEEVGESLWEHKNS